MDILKLLFEHDMLLEKQPHNDDPRNNRMQESSLADFMRPIPTYSRFYIAGTRQEGENFEFGLNLLNNYKSVLNALDASFRNFKKTTSTGKQTDSFSSAFQTIQPGEAVVLHTDDLAGNPAELNLGMQIGVFERLPQLISFLDRDIHVVFKEPALNGFDIHIFSRQNLYEILFNPLSSLIGQSLRLFSINGKKAKNEKLFYFETYRIDRPPHGFNEVV